MAAPNASPSSPVSADKPKPHLSTALGPSGVPQGLGTEVSTAVTPHQSEQAVHVPSQSIGHGSVTAEPCGLSAQRWQMPSLLKEQIQQLPMQPVELAKMRAGVCWGTVAGQCGRPAADGQEKG